MNDTTIIPAQLGFFVLEPFANEKNQYSGFHKYPVVAWKITDYTKTLSAFSIAVPVLIATELDDCDISKMAMEMPSGQVLWTRGANEYWFVSSKEWFDSVREVV